MAELTNLAIFYRARLQTAQKLVREHDPKGFEICEELLLAPELGRFHRAGAHMLLSTNDVNGTWHAKQAVELYEGMVREEPNDQELREFLTWSKEGLRLSEIETSVMKPPVEEPRGQPLACGDANGPYGDSIEASPGIDAQKFPPEKPSRESFYTSSTAGESAGPRLSQQAVGDQIHTSMSSWGTPDKMASTQSPTGRTLIQGDNPPTKKRRRAEGQMMGQGSQYQYGQSQGGNTPTKKKTPNRPRDEGQMMGARSSPTGGKCDQYHGGNQVGGQYQGGNQVGYQQCQSNPNTGSGHQRKSSTQNQPGFSQNQSQNPYDTPNPSSGNQRVGSKEFKDNEGNRNDGRGGSGA